MSQSPQDEVHVEHMQDPDSPFRKHLDRLNELVRDGGSWSGHERNCAFLNTRAGRFATVSAVSGLDFDDDARSVAVVDWDQDGKLDLWVANRTAPQLRFLRNQSPGAAHYVALQLRGTTSNRDAIGARVQLALGPGEPPLNKTLRAGEGFLSQSSKWLHFGLGALDAVESVTVRWPGGQQETFSGIQVDARYRLTQGTGVAERVAPRDRSLLAASPSEWPKSDDQVRVVLSARLPVPTLRYKQYTGSQTAVPLNNGHPTLLNLWASWCSPCLREIGEWSTEAERFRSAGLNVVVLTVDEMDENVDFTAQTARAALRRIACPFSEGVATGQLKTRLDQIHHWSFARKIDMPIPTSFLFDSEGRLAVIYRGAATAEQILSDLELLKLDDEQLLAAALPFSGRWRRRPHPIRPLETAIQLMHKGDIADAAEFVRRNRELLFPHREFALMAIWLGDEYSKRGGIARAAYFYDQALRRDPTNLTVLNNLAWQLATNPDDRVRNPERAIHWAQRAATSTQESDPYILDTLATAYAAAQRFGQAIELAERAIGLANAAGDTELAGRIYSRLTLFKQRKP